MRSFRGYHQHRFPFAVLFVVLLAVLASVGFSRRARTWLNPHSPTATLSKLPPVVLWAWERPESLDYLDSSKATVAFLSQTIYLRGDRSVVRPRLQPLAVPENAPLIAVTRIESDPNEKPSLNSTQLSEVVQAIASSASLSGVVSVQLDFDATTSERTFYRSLLFDLRKQLPESTSLSITALASWCQGDNWLEDLPIDEAVPMLFRMGVERHQILSRVASGEVFRSSKCRNSAGISTDEPFRNHPQVQRVYIFHPTSWQRSAVESVLRNSQQ